ncbi:MAG: hypothetical protein ACRD0U_00410, partial [Acidimicrobiales bacterium]
PRRDRPRARRRRPLSFFDPGELGSAGPAYAFAHDTGAAARAAGVQALVVDTADPMTVHVEAGPQPLLVHQVQIRREVTAKLMDLPGRVDLRVDRGVDDAFTATYDASGPVERLEAFVTDPVADIGPGIRTIEAHIDGLPAGLVVDTTGGVTLAVPDDPATPERDRVAQVEVLASRATRFQPAADGTLELELDEAAGLLPDEDGIAVEASGTGNHRRQLTYGRVGDLTEVSFTGLPTIAPTDGYRDDRSFGSEAPVPLGAVETVDGAATLTRPTAVVLGRVAGGALAVRLHDDPPSGPVEYFEARLDAPPERVALTMSTAEKRVDGPTPCTPDAGSGCFEFQQPCPAGGDGFCESAFRLDYGGNRASGSLTIDTNAGDRENLSLHVPSLPASVSFCLATDGTCTGYAKNVNVTNSSLRFEASADVTGLVVLDCVEDRDDGPACGRGGAGLDETGFDDDVQYLTARIVGVRFVELEMSVPPTKGGLVGHVFVNTTLDGTTHPLDGVISTRARSFDPDCSPPEGDVKRTRAQLDDVTAEQRFATIQIQNTGCTGTGVTVPNRNHPGRGVMNCAGTTSIDLGPRTPGFGEVFNELCRDDLEPDD